MRYIDYAIKYLIRRILRILFKPKFLFTIVIVFLLLFFVFKINSQAYQGDNSYTDKNTTINLAYDSVNNDLINRLSNSSSQSVATIKEKLKDSSLSYYVYWGAYDGSSMLSGNTFDRNELCIAFFPLSSTTATAPGFDVYMGMQTSIISVTGAEVYYFEGNNIGGSFSDRQIFLPGVLFGYRNIDLVSFINDSSAEEASQIVGALDEQTNTIQQQTDKLDNSINSTDYDESTISIDDSSASGVDNSSTNSIFTNLFTNFSNLLNNENWDTVSTITLKLPFVPENSPGITFRSDMISKIINGTLLATLVTVAWYSLFGLYVFKFANKIYLSIKSGDILGGLSLNDEVITSTML